MNLDDVLDSGVRLRGTLLSAEAAHDPVDAEQLRQEVDLLARGLQQAGLRSGDRLALLMPQCVEWYALHFAASRLGVLTVPLNTRYTAREVLGILRLSGARTVAVAPGFMGLGLETVAQQALELPDVPVGLVISTGAAPLDGWVGYQELRATGRQAPPVEPATGDDPVVVFGTSGTTSAPKLAVHGADGVTRHLFDVAATLELSPDDTVMCVLPPCGAYGYTVALAGLAAGSRLVLVDHFDARRLDALVRAHDGTVMAVTEAILRTALQEAPAASALAAMRVIATAGGSVREIDVRLEAGPASLVNVYGASEVLALFAIRPLAAPREVRIRPGGTTISPQLAVRVLDPSTGDPLPVGGEGALELFGPSVFREYLENPSATQEAFSEDGWYRTGDRARLEDDRTFEYLSRMTDSMRLRGHLVSPAQVEEVLLDHPAVREAQVVGVPDPGTGEDFSVGFAVLEPASVVGEAELRAWCRSRLAAFKVPHRVLVLGEIPVTPSANGDKALKRELREHARRVLGESS
jgi:fatty-acyl-CoA synthase